MGIGRASGENKAIDAAKAAINSSLLDMSIDGARGIVFTITGGLDLSMSEVSEAAKVITAAADEEAKIIFGAVIDETLKDEIKITVVATGFDGKGGSSSVTKMEPIKNTYTSNSFIDESSERESVPSSTSWADKTKTKLSVFKNTPIKPIIEKKMDQPISDSANEEDDLSVPAFIRKKMM